MTIWLRCAKHDQAAKETAIADGMCPQCLAAETDRLRDALQQIKDVCEDNTSAQCNHYMAVKFVWGVADDALYEGPKTDTDRVKV